MPEFVKFATNIKNNNKTCNKNNYTDLFSYDVEISERVNLFVKLFSTDIFKLCFAL